MGIHGQVLHTIIRRFFSGGALVENQTGQVITPDAMKEHGAVLISDLLTQLREVNLGPGGNYEAAVTGDQLVELFVYYVNRAVESGHFRAYVGVVDVQHLTPREKLAEQKSRSTRRPIQSYPKDSIFTPEGIVTREAGMAQPINTQRVFADRVFRVQLFRFIANQLEQRPYLIMKGVDFVMDFDEHEYFVIKDGIPSWKAHNRTLGEADLQMMVWAHMYSDRHVIWIQSIDRDLIPIITSYIHQIHRMNRKGKIDHCLRGFWYSMGFQWEKNKMHPNAPKNYTFRAIDMMRFTLELKTRLKWNPLHFVLACILCGTDFIKKSDLVNLVSVPMVFWAVCVAGKEYTKRVGTQQAAGSSGPDVSGAYFVLLLQTIYTEHYTNCAAYKGLKPDDRALRYLSDGVNKAWTDAVQEDHSAYEPMSTGTLWGISDKAYQKSQKAKAKREAKKAKAVAASSSQFKPPKDTQRKMTQFMSNKLDNLGRRMRFPQLKTVEKTFGRVAWNMRYWILDVCSMDNHPVYA